jgi:FtsP/CotA-like multicopper oxidase with cupredoxin domain
MTPDRAGTFIYHTHSNEVVQLSSGLYGALLVLEPGAEPDPNERVFLLGGGGPGREAAPYLNGRPVPSPVELSTGVAHRLRFINISTFGTQRIRLVGDTTPQSWRALAKDGADLPPTQATVRPAMVSLGPGETFDFELLRTAPVTLELEITTIRRPPLPPLVMRVPVKVGPASPAQ